METEPGQAQWIRGNLMWNFDEVKKTGELVRVCRVLCIDYGWTADVPSNNVYELPDDLKEIPSQVRYEFHLLQKHLIVTVLYCPRL